MNILVLGATGLIGSHLLPALRKAGHRVTGASRKRPVNAASDDWHQIDFARMTDAADWLSHLPGVDAVINCVGIIRESEDGEFDRAHRAAPVALFAACEQLGISRVIHISALGSKVDASVEYWRSKGAAEEDLLRRCLNATVIRPSLVYGPDGASSRLFLSLATLPVLAMPVAHQALVQPIHVDDLTEIICKLVLMNHETAPREIATVGPRPLTLAGYLLELRCGLHASPALVLDLPMPIARLTARLASLQTSSALTPDSLRMLEESVDGGNTANATPAATLLNRRLLDPANFANPAQRASAVMSWGIPAIRITMAALWLITAFVSWFGWSHTESGQWLGRCGIPAPWQEPVLLAASVMDALVGLGLLFISAGWIWLLQLLFVGFYTVIMSICLPEFWLHPFGILSKNLPLLALIAVMWRLEEGRKQGRKTR